MKFRGRAILIMPPSVIVKFIYERIRAYFNEVLIFSSVQDSIKSILDNDPPSLIIGSYILTDGTFFDFLDRFHSSTKSKIPIVMLTSEHEQELIKQALIRGVTDVINKRVLTEKLDDLLFDLFFSFDPQSLEGTILCVEDSATHRDVIERYLSETKLKIVFYEDVESAINFLKKNSVDIVLIDFLLKGPFTGLDLVRTIRKKLENKLLPIIVMTGFDDTLRRVEIIKSGVDDYLGKPFNKEDLLIKINNLLTKYRMIKSLSLETEKLRGQMLRDPLTNAYNRNVLEFLEKELNLSYIHGYQISIIMFDIDNFKSINDNYGHLVGDKVLVEFANLIKGHIRTSDYLIRFGGEEFLLALINASKSQAFNKAELIRKELEKLSIDGIKVTTSAGVVSPEDRVERNLEDLIKVADSALYEAKRTGKNKTVVY